MHCEDATLIRNGCISSYSLAFGAERACGGHRLGYGSMCCGGGGEPIVCSNASTQAAEEDKVVVPCCDTDLRGALFGRHVGSTGAPVLALVVGSAGDLDHPHNASLVAGPTRGKV